MKLLEKRPSMLMITEHIEMQLFASEESYPVVSVHSADEHFCSYYRHLEHPLLSETEEDPEPQIQTRPEQQFKLKRVPSVRTHDSDDCPLFPDLREGMEIELEVFPPLNTPQSEQVVKTSLRFSTTPLTVELDSVLREFRQHAVYHSLQWHITPSWSEPLLSALRLLDSPGFCYRATLVVSSSDTDVEADGRQCTLREFFRLALLELQHSSVFEGLPGRLFLTHDLTALKDRKYYKAGALIGWSLAHGGPGPQCIHPAFYQLMCGQNASLDDFDWRDIANPEAQVRLKRLNGGIAVTSCFTELVLNVVEKEQLQSATTMDLCDYVESYGLPDNNFADIPSIYHRVARMAAQFTEGLDSCGGLWETVRSHWEAFAPVMTSMGQKTSSEGA